MVDSDIMEIMLRIEELVSRLRHENIPFLECNTKQLMAIIRIIKSEVFVDE
jgi:hypothetical protein